MNIVATIQETLDYEIAGIKVIEMIEFAVIFIIAVIIARIARMAVRRRFKEKLSPTTLNNMEKVVYYGIILIGFFIALPKGVSLGGLLVAGGIAGIVIGFASQTVVANLISGLFLMVERPVEIGDSIAVGDVSGVVKDIKVLSTTIRTWDGIYVRIPNEKVFNSNIYNYVAHGARRFEYTIGIRYSDDASKAIDIIKGILAEHPLVLKYPEPDVFVSELGESSVIIAVKIWAPSSHWYSVKKELLWKIKTILEENGIEIPFPQRVIWMAGGEKKEGRGKGKQR
ncbi:MAG: mechanosensitive ion channel family protein [Thermoplasmata archaeon]|nr:mechanosensitive ion channel family protein [Thermoplasmata archaeon]